MRVELAFPISLHEIACIIQAPCPLEDDVIHAITIDSREAQAGDLFFCIKGERFDGEDYAKQVTKLGGYAVSLNYGSRRLVVNNVNDALLSLAENYINRFDSIKKKIAITGSVGKTTTKELLSFLLSGRYSVHKNEGNKNNEIGLPITLFSTPKDAEILITEMGMNHRGEIKKLSECVRPDIGIITNIGSSHIGNLGSKEAIADAKLEIISGMKERVLIVPSDEPLIQKSKDFTSFSTSDIKANFYLKSIENNIIKIYKNGNEYISSRFAPVAPYLKKCLLCAVAAADLCQTDPSDLEKRISLITDDISRQRYIERQNLLFITDCYNSSPESISAGFEMIKTRYPKEKIGLVLADIGELGEHSKRIHYEVGKSISTTLFSRVFLFGEFAEIMRLGAIDAGFPNEFIYINEDPDSPGITAEQIKATSNAFIRIYLKGSRFMRLERLIDYFD